MALRHLTSFFLAWFILIYWHTSADSSSQGINSTGSTVKNSSFDQPALLGQWQQYFTFPRMVFHLQKEFFNSVLYGFKQFNVSCSKHHEKQPPWHGFHYMTILRYTNGIQMASSWNNVASSHVNMTLTMSRLVDRWPEPGPMVDNLRQPQQIRQLAPDSTDVDIQQLQLPANKVVFA